MKKKLIQEVPFIQTKKTRKEYAAAVEIKEIEGEEHLFLDIYRRPDWKIPVIRGVYTKKDWIMYLPESGWSRGGLYDERRYRYRWGGDEQNTAISKQGIQTIQKFTNRQKYAQYEKWQRSLKSLEDDIRFERYRKKDHNARTALKERIANTPPLPEDLEEWARKHYDTECVITYKRKGKKAVFQCLECGMSWTSETGVPETYEEQLKHIVPVPRKGDIKICECCGKTGKLEQEGRISGCYGISFNCYVGQKYKDQGALIRYIQIGKYMRKGEPASYSVTEIARNYFEQGKKRVQKDYHLYNCYSEKAEWLPHNIGGYGNIVQEIGGIYPGTFEELKGTILQYSGLKEYRDRKQRNIKVTKYLEKYLEHPCMEMLIKMGMDDIVDRIMDDYIVELSENSMTPEGLLGIYKHRIRILGKKHGSRALWDVLRLERTEGHRWKEEECFLLEKLKPDTGKLSIALRYMSVRQLLNRIEKYAGCKLDMECSNAVHRIQHTVVTYLDYLEMRSILGYDLNNSIYAYPRDLEDAHGKMVIETNEKEMDKRIREVEERFTQIPKKYKALKKIYEWENGEYFIRPAETAREIVLEGRTLHHCVGGDNYLKSHNEGRSYILFLRHVETPEIPYYTIEIREDTILQWYGEKDTKPNKEIIQEWLDYYILHLKNRCVQIAV